VRVVLASPSLDVGGAERIVVELARGLTRAGAVVAVSGPAGPLDGELPREVAR